MRSSTLIAMLTALAVCLLFVSGAVANDSVNQKRSLLDEAADEDLAARSLPSSLDSDRLLELEKRQIGVGGGAGVATTITGVQTISGYTPPPSSVLPDPTPSTGVILSPSQIPGYGNLSSSGMSSFGGSSNGLVTLFATAFAVAMAAGAGWAFVM